MRLTMNLNRCRFYDPETETLYFMGLDLGQAKDFTALAIIERPAGIPFRYHIRGLKRFPLKTSYTDIAEEMKIIIKRPDIQPNLLLIDNTGVGAAVSDIFRKMGFYFGAITITGGTNPQRTETS